MIIKCMKSELISGINIVSKAVPSRTTLSIQECILIDARTSVITLTANDMELGIETEITGIVEEKGAAAIDARMFSDIIRKLPENEVTIETDENLHVRIVCEKAKFQIMAKEWEDFSRISYLEKENPVCISQFALKEMIRQTIFSVSANDSNRIMTGELLEIRDNVLRIISLDGHRISVRRLIMKDHYPDSSVIVPGKTLQEVLKILPGDTNSDVQIYLSTNHIMMVYDSTTIVSRLIEGTYFRVDQMISNDYETKVTVNRKELLDCIDRSILLVMEEDRKPIIMTIEDQKMELRISSQIGSMDEMIDVEMEGREIMIGFNPKYLIDALRVIDDEKIDIYYMNAKAPCFIRDSTETYIYLVLPVNFVV